MQVCTEEYRVCKRDQNVSRSTQVLASDRNHRHMAAVTVLRQVTSVYEQRTCRSESLLSSLQSAEAAASSPLGATTCSLW